MINSFYIWYQITYPILSVFHSIIEPLQEWNPSSHLTLSLYFKKQFIHIINPSEKMLLQVEEALIFIANQALVCDIYELVLLTIEIVVAKMTHIHLSRISIFPASL